MVTKNEGPCIYCGETVRSCLVPFICDRCQTGDAIDPEELKRLFQDSKKRQEEDGGVWEEYTGDGR